MSKSTLHSWIRAIKRPEKFSQQDRIRWIKEIQPLGAASIKKKRMQEIEKIADKVRQEVLQWSFLADVNVQKALLSFLYWTEGQKLPERGAPVKFANTDPRLVLLFVTLLKRCYVIDPKKIKVRLYIHWYHKPEIVKTFWKDLLGIPEVQFAKIYVKPRSKTKRFRKNFMGICFVVYQSVDLRQEIMYTAYSVYEQLHMLSPVV